MNEATTAEIGTRSVDRADWACGAGASSDPRDGEPSSLPGCRLARRAARRPSLRSALAGLLLLVAGRSALGQISGPIHTYSVNEGKNGAHDVAYGEFAPDVGGSIPWDRYAQPGHVFAAG